MLDDARQAQCGSNGLLIGGAFCPVQLGEEVNRGETKWQGATAAKEG
jgi:hypothetical protein